MEPAAGAGCDATDIWFRVRDHRHRLSGVRLEQGVLPRGTATDFAYDAGPGVWELRLPRPAVQRLEYKLELRRPGGATESVCDPDNPLRVGGGFGDSSELRCPGYREPAWLDLPPAPGRWRDVHLPMPSVRGETVARVWSPAAPADRVLVAHDGPDYDRYGRLGRYTTAMIGAGRVPPYHLVLLPAGDRLEWYSASRAYARALATDVLPKLAAELGRARPLVGVGASLGGLAMLHCQRRHPAAFAGLFLQSSSFFRPRHDSHESGFRRYLRIVRFTGGVHRGPAGTAIPATLTCGAVEENRANNADMADSLRRQGYDVTFAEVPDAHTWTGWRDAYDPHLTSLLQRVF